MSERIKNGDFSQGTSYWINGAGGGYSYDVYNEVLRATSEDSDANPYLFKIKQAFLVAYQVIDARITVYNQWECDSGTVSNGTVKFWVKLQKPDLSFVQLAYEAREAEEGNGYICSNLDITSHFSQQGTYHLWLDCEVTAAEQDGSVFTVSYGWYDNVSIDVKIKKTKTVFEAVGATDEPQGLVKKTVKENTGASESYSTVFTKPKLVSEATQALESFSILIKKTVKEVVGAIEYYFKANFLKTVKEDVGASESYSTILIECRTLKEDVGVCEKLTALKTSGNLEVYIDIKPLTAWQEKDKAVTEWIKEKKEILS